MLISMGLFATVREGLCVDFTFKKWGCSQDGDLRGVVFSKHDDFTNKNLDLARQ